MFCLKETFAVERRIGTARWKVFFPLFTFLPVLTRYEVQRDSIAASNDVFYALETVTNISRVFIAASFSVREFDDYNKSVYNCIAYTV